MSDPTTFWILAIGLGGPVLLSLIDILRGIVQEQAKKRADRLRKE